MFRKPSLLFVMGVSVVAVAGCEKKAQTSTQVAHQRMDEAKAAGFPALTDMADNAVLHEMAVSDVHFVPHTAELNGTGAARLERMAAMLQAYGGTVRYTTYTPDDKLVAQRIDHVREYLAVAGCPMDRVEVKPMISGGRTMPAEDAIKVMNRGTVKAATAAAQPGFGPTATPVAPQ